MTKVYALGPAALQKPMKFLKMSSYSGPKDSGLHPVIVRWANWAYLDPQDIFVVEYIKHVTIIFSTEDKISGLIYNFNILIKKYNLPTIKNQMKFV